MPHSPPSKPSSDKSGRVAHLYLDESNFKISGAKAEEKRRRLDPKRHLDWHYDIRKLRGIIRKVTGMKVISVYGSNLHRGRVYQDLVLHSSRLFNFHQKGKGGEKKVDTNLVRGISLDATHLPKSNKTNVFVLVSGDRDMTPAVEYALEYDYDVHVLLGKTLCLTNTKNFRAKTLSNLHFWTTSSSLSPWRGLVFVCGNFSSLAIVLYFSTRGMLLVNWSTSSFHPTCISFRV